MTTRYPITRYPDGGAQAPVDGTPMSDADFEALPEADDGSRYELVNGRLRIMSPTGMDHSELQGDMYHALRNYCPDKRRAKVYVGDLGVRLAPGEARAPDVALIFTERITADIDTRRFSPIPPDLAVEIVSPNDTYSKVLEKARMWLRHGVRLVWTVDPAGRAISVYTPNATGDCTLGVGDTLDGGDVLPGFKLSLAEFFGVEDSEQNTESS
jgi:Uma2 family endonuclease